MKENIRDRKLFKRTDILILTIILLLAIGSYFIFQLLSGDAVHAEISYDGNAVMELDLRQNADIVLPSFPNVTFQVKDGAVRFLHSDCPDKICVKTGFISHSYETSVCLPNRLMLRIISGNNSSDQPDSVVG